MDQRTVVKGRSFSGKFNHRNKQFAQVLNEIIEAILAKLSFDDRYYFRQLRLQTLGGEPYVRITFVTKFEFPASSYQRHHLPIPKETLPSIVSAEARHRLIRCAAGITALYPHKTTNSPILLPTDCGRDKAQKASRDASATQATSAWVC